MQRRNYLKRSVSIPALSSISAATEQQYVPLQTSGDDGENVGTYHDIDSAAFPDTVTIGWISDRFIQLNDEDAPVIGHEVSSTALVLEVAQSLEEFDVLQTEFDWEDVDYTNADAFEQLFEPHAWALDRSTSFTTEFFEDHAIAWITGIHSEYYRPGIDAQESEIGSIPSDRLFYDLYGHAPFMFAVFPTAETPDPGSVIDFEATVRHTSEDDSHPDSAPNGGYLAVDTSTVRETLRTPDTAWEDGTSATFTGLQEHPQPQLTSATTAVEYDDELLRPTGGSIVTKRGTVTDSSEDSTDMFRQHELRSERHDILVGSTLSRSWEDDDDGEEQTTGPVNVSIVVDTSDSMSEQDATVGGSQISRLGAVQEVLPPFIDLFREGVQTSVVEFNSSANIAHPLTEIDGASREEVQESVRNLTERNRTTIGGGLLLGKETIEDEPGEKTMILLSDGSENEPPYVDDVLSQLRNAGIEVYTFGIGAEIDEQQLEYIAEQTGGTAEIDPGVEQIKDFYFQVIEDAQHNPRLSSIEGELDENDRMGDDCKVDSSCEDAQFSLSYEGSDMDLIVTDPQGNEVGDGPGIDHREGDAHEVWTVDDPEPGEWGYEVEVLSVDAPQETFAQATADSSVDGELFVADDLYDATGFLRIQLLVTEGLERYTGANSRVEIRPPNGDDDDGIDLSLGDDGTGPDDVAADGIYSTYFHPTVAGEYEFRTIVEGGEYDELQREFVESVEIPYVVDTPARPYQSETSFSDMIGEYGPLVGALALMGGIGVAILRLLESSDE